MKRLIFPVFIIILVIVELILAFQGPMAFRKATSIMVSNPFSQGFNQEEQQALRKHIEQKLAESGQFNVVSHELISDYMIENEGLEDFQFDSNMDFLDYAEMAANLDIEQVAIASIYRTSDFVSIGVYIRKSDSGNRLHTFSYRAKDLGNFFSGELSTPHFMSGELEVDLAADFRGESAGIELFDYIFFLFVFLEVIIALLFFFRLPYDTLNQSVIVIASLLFLFSYVYAQNAGLDYVQRYIANGGAIDLAPDSATEQLYAIVRFLPLLFCNFFIYVGMRFRRKRRNSIRKSLPLDSASKKASFINILQRFRIWIRRVAKQWGLVLTMISSLLFALAFPSFVSIDGWALLAWVSLIPLFISINRNNILRGIFYCISFGAFSTLFLNYWHATYSYVSLAFSVGISSILFVLWSVPYVLLVKLFRKWGYIPAATLWILFDQLRSIGFIGYPWGFIGVSQYSILPVIQVADLGGVYMVSLVVLLFNSAIAWIICAKPEVGIKKNDFLWPIAVAGGLLGLTLIYGIVQLLIPVSGENGEISIALNQQNTDPRKHDSDLSYETLMRLSNQALDEAKARDIPLDLIVWPEGGFRPDIRYWYERPESPMKTGKQVQTIFSLLNETDTWLVTGSRDHEMRPIDDPDSSRTSERVNFNSSYLLNNNFEVSDIYHKIHLVPFTEHFPYKEEYPWLADMLDKFNTSNWGQGDEHVIYEHPKARFFTPICFEDIFPDDVRRFALLDAQLIVNISNDYWSLTPVEGKQHAIHALFRAVENRLPMVRSTASGLTTYITEKGQLSEELPEYYTEGYLLVNIPISQPSKTLYMLGGDWLPVGLGILTVIVAVFLLIWNLFQKKGVYKIEL